MLYVSNRRDNKFCLIDSENGMADYYLPGQLASLIKEGKIINGIKLTGNKIEISISKPLTFNTISQGYFDITAYNLDSERTAAEISNIVGFEDFYKLFNSYKIAHGSYNSLYMTLKDIDFNNGLLKFGFLYDTNSMGESIISLDNVRAILDGVPYNARLILNPELENNFDINTNYVIGIKVPYDTIDLLCNSLVELFEDNDIASVLSDNTSIEYKNFLIKKLSLNINLNNSDACSIFFRYDGLELPIILSARLSNIQKDTFSGNNSIYYDIIREKYI